MKIFFFPSMYKLAKKKGNHFYEFYANICKRVKNRFSHHLQKPKSKIKYLYLTYLLSSFPKLIASQFRYRTQKKKKNERNPQREEY